ncbi:hypothetical protein GCM10023196_031470 [Actinoallomurus vinaceus]|uniref:PPE family domain-containing protein n=1 Tax=Actinoallomurus vinaceus TaxID=1080074 RepID=A0ABP8U7M6_9ACTN
MAVEHKTYVIKSGGRPQGASSYGTPEDVQKLIAGTNPGTIKNAAVAYDEIGNAIIKAQNALWDAAKVLADHWSGPAADSAQLALRRLYATAGELVVRNTETARTLQWYGGSILPMYRNIQWPKKNTDSPAAKAAADQVMKNLNERIAQTWDGMPSQIEKNLPKLAYTIDKAPEQQPSGGAPLGGSGGGIPGGGGAKVPTSHRPDLSIPHGGSQAPVQHYPGGHSPLPGPSFPGHGSKGTDLAGITPDGGSTGGGGAHGLGGDPGIGTSGLGAPAGNGIGPGTTPLGGNGVTGTGYMGGHPSGLQGRGVSNGGRVSGNEMPFASGSGRSDEKERTRTTWLSEDEDVWTGGEEAVHGLIGEARNRVAEREHDADEFLSMDELQELLDLVGDETGEETGGPFSKESSVDLADDPLSRIVDARFDAMAEEAAGPLVTNVSDLDETTLGTFSIGRADLDDIDDLGKRDS